MLKIGKRGLLAAVVACGLSAAVQAQTQITTGAGNLSGQLKNIATSGAPINFGVHTGDARFIYAGQQDGNIRILDFNQANPLIATSFLNVDTVLGADSTGARVLINNNERGLIGSAFHPDFNTVGAPGFHKFYTFTSETVASTGTQSFNFVNPLEPAGTIQYNCQSVIREWTVGNPNAQGVMTVDTGVASRVLMRVGKPGQFHNGGGMAFDNAGYLYLSLGDGGGGANNGGNDGGNDFNALQGHTNPGNPDTGNAAVGGWTGQGNAQDRRTPYGKVLRINPISATTAADPNANPSGNGQYQIPKTNPFTLDRQVTNPTPGFQASWVDEIYAYGFRNPFRISVDRIDTTKVYAADVGQDRNTISREEVNLIVNGGNYGWVVKSGTEINNRPTSPTPTNTFPVPNGVTLIDPVAQYRTTQEGDGGLAVIGGFVYRGSLLPHLYGKYIFGDLNRGDGTNGRLLYTDLTDPSLAVFELNITLGSGTIAKPNQMVNGLAQDANGELYFLFANGQVVQLVPEPSAGLLGLGAILFGAGARRRRTAK